MIERFVPLILLLILSACSVPVTSVPLQVEPGARLHLFLQPLPQEIHSLQLTINAISARDSQGKEVQLLDTPLVLGNDEHRSQRKILAQSLPAGEYQGLSLMIENASLDTEDGPFDLLIERSLQWLPTRFRIDSDHAQTLFLALSSDRLVTDGYQLTPKFALWEPQRPLPGLKGAVSHPQNGTISLFEKKNWQVYSIAALGRHPESLVLDQESRHIFITLEEEDSLLIFDLVRERVERKLQLRPGDRPHHLSLTADSRFLVATLRGSNAVSIIETAPFVERHRVLFSTPAQKSLAGGGNNRCYVLLPQSNAIGLIDTARGSVETVVSFAETPIDGLISADRQNLYLVTENSAELLVLNARTLHIDQRIFIGFGARAIAEATNGLLYIGLGNGEIAVIDPKVAIPIDHFQTGSRIQDIVIDRMENSLLVLSGSHLVKYDLVSKNKLGVLDLGSPGADLTVMGEL